MGSYLVEKLGLIVAFLTVINEFERCIVIDYWELLMSYISWNFQAWATLRTIVYK